MEQTLEKREHAFIQRLQQLKATYAELKEQNIEEQNNHPEEKEPAPQEKQIEVANNVEAPPSEEVKAIDN